MNGEYRIGDAIAELRQLDAESAAVVALDANWAAPERNEAFGVEYVTHPITPEAEADFTESELARHYIDTSRYISEFIDAAWRVLQSGGWLILDADSYAKPRYIEYLRETYGWARVHDDAGRAYESGGFRKTGGVTYLSSDGTPDESTPGQKLSTGGYPVVFAHKGETDRRTTVSARQIADSQRETYGWGTVKPAAPYLNWIEGLTEPGERVVVPCAGTAPAAIAAERLGREWVAIDSERDAREAFERRAESELAEGGQSTLPESVACDGGTSGPTSETEGDTGGSR